MPVDLCRQRGMPPGSTRLRHWGGGSIGRFLVASFAAVALLQCCLHGRSLLTAPHLTERPGSQQPAKDPRTHFQPRHQRQRRVWVALRLHLWPSAGLPSASGEEATTQWLANRHRQSSNYVPNAHALRSKRTQRLSNGGSWSFHRGRGASRWHCRCGRQLVRSAMQ